MSKPLFSYFDKYRDEDADLLMSLVPYLESVKSSEVRLNTPLQYTAMNSVERHCFRIPKMENGVEILEIDIPRGSRLDPLDILEIDIPRSSKLAPLEYLTECLKAVPNAAEYEIPRRSIERLDGIALAIKHSLSSTKIDTLHIRPASRYKPLAAMISANGKQVEWIAEDDHPWVEFHYQPIVPELSIHHDRKTILATVRNVSAEHVLPSQNDPVEDMRLLALLPKADPIIIKEEDWDFIF